MAATFVGILAVGWRCWVQPLEVLCVLDRDVAVFDDDHEDGLDDGDDEEDEHVTEELGVEKVGLLDSGVGVEERVACLHREHRVKAALETAEVFLILPGNGD